ncbi:MAG: hypothetical protein KAT14_02675 [Candidatus Marinimicrobia bacterium]|nr:hypothetical protein [Candidatus Neomarinimicrobiota bacterium]
MKRCILLLFIFILAVTTNAKDLPLYVTYEKYKEGITVEKGRVFYHPHRGMHLFVDQPVIQRVKMAPDRYMYYYPDENIALYMNNRNRILASESLQLFLNTDREDLGLSDLGFILTDHYFTGDTLIKVWEIEGKKKKEHIQIDVFYHQKRVYKIISYSGNGEEIKRVYFDDWQARDHYYYPMYIRVLEDGNRSVYIYHDLRIIKGLPDSVIELFTLPEDCKIYEYEW